MAPGCLSMVDVVILKGGDVLIRNVLVAAIRIQSTPNLARWLGRLCRSCPYQIGKDQTHIWEFVASTVCVGGVRGSVAGVHAWAWGVHVARGSRDGGVTRGQEALAAAIRIRSAPNLARWLRRLGPGHHPSLGAIVSIFGNLWRRPYGCMGAPWGRVGECGSGGWDACGVRSRDWCNVTATGL